MNGKQGKDTVGVYGYGLYDEEIEELLISEDELFAVEVRELPVHSSVHRPARSIPSKFPLQFTLGAEVGPWNPSRLPAQHNYFPYRQRMARTTAGQQRRCLPPGANQFN
jgi:hypothetical protein